MLYYSTFLVVCISLWISSAVNFLRLSNDHDETHSQLHSLDFLVNTFAATCYSLLLVLWKKTKSYEKCITEIRYVDWITTVPILLYILIKRFGDTRRRNLTFGILISSILMIGSGFLASGKSNIWYYIGFIFYGFTFALLYKSMFERQRKTEKQEPLEQRNKKMIFTATAVIWGVYGLVFLIQNNKAKNVSFNILDLISKAGFTAAMIALF